MQAAYFYIEYRDGTCRQQEFKSMTAARRAYQQYERDPEDSARAWGWEIKPQEPTLSQQLRDRRSMAV